MSGLVRPSKYRHVIANDPKNDQIFSNFRLANQYAESNGVKASASYFIVALDGGGGPIAAVPLNKPGRFAPDCAVFSTHTAAVVDFDFSPFFDNVFGTCSEDTTVKVWQIPEAGMTTSISTPLSELRGHTKRVTTVRFHPTVGNVVLSSSLDQTVKVWDCTKSACICDLALPQPPMDMVVDCFGKSVAVATKDKSIRTFDPRSGVATACIDTAHEGAKTNKLLYLGDSGLLLSTGFNKTSTRQFKLWDPRNTSVELAKTDLDNASGIIMPFFEADSGLIFLAGKGDGNIRYYELVAGACHPITDFKSTVPNKGVTLISRRGVNVAGCEVARVLKVTTDSVIPLSFIVPRKSEAFQDDLYADTAGWLPASTADEWLGGADKLPALISLDPRVGATRFNNGLFSLDTAARSCAAAKQNVFATPSKTEPEPEPAVDSAVADPAAEVVEKVEPVAVPVEPVTPSTVKPEVVASKVSTPAPAASTTTASKTATPAASKTATPAVSKTATPAASKTVAPATPNPVPAAVVEPKKAVAPVVQKEAVAVPVTPPPAKFDSELEAAYDKIKRLETLVLELSNSKIQRLESMVEELNKEAAESVTIPPPQSPAETEKSAPAPSEHDKTASSSNVADMLSKLDNM